MTTLSVLSDEEVQKLADGVFSQADERWNTPDLIVRATPNFDGEEALYITAVFPDGVDRPDGPRQIELQSELGRSLLARGDQRFAYLSALTRSDFEELRHLEAEHLPDA